MGSTVTKSTDRATAPNATDAWIWSSGSDLLDLFRWIRPTTAQRVRSAIALICSSPRRTSESLCVSSPAERRETGGSSRTRTACFSPRISPCRRRGRAESHEVKSADVEPTTP